MTDQSNQTSQGTLHAQELRQFLLAQLSGEQKVVEELSDEELETIAGGILPTISSADTEELSEQEMSTANGGAITNLLHAADNSGEISGRSSYLSPSSSFASFSSAKSATFSSVSSQHTTSDAAGIGNKIKKWAQKPSNQVAIGGPVVTAGAAFMVGFVNKATS